MSAPKGKGGSPSGGTSKTAAAAQKAVAKSSARQSTSYDFDLDPIGSRYGRFGVLAAKTAPYAFARTMLEDREPWRVEMLAEALRLTIGRVVTHVGLLLLVDEVAHASGDDVQDLPALADVAVYQPVPLS